MGRGFQGAALRHLNRLFAAGSLAGASDRELLAEFQNRRDEAAFEAMVSRYGRLVLNVGRKLLHDSGDVEDAFQATFLVLIKKPPRLRVGESLGPWISTVAYRVAARARAKRIRLNRLESTAGAEPASLTTDDSNALALHEEVSRLPDRLRRPVVFCYLEGLTHERAAERLGCPVGTVRSRLARARSLLHRRLLARGVAPVVAPIEALLASSRPVEPSFGLKAQTLRLATASHVGWPEAGVASASLLSLVNGVVRMMKIKQALVAISLLFPVGILAAGAQVYQQGVVVEGRDVNSPNASRNASVKKTYFIGDLGAFRNYQSEQAEERPALAAGPIAGRPGFDRSRLIDLIRSVVAPGTWLSNDTEAPGSRIGSVTPTADGCYLTISHTADVHHQVEALFSNLRPIVRASMWNAVDQVAPNASKEPIYVKSPSPIKAGAAEKPEPPGSEPGAASQRRVRIRQLLRQLQNELDALDAESMNGPH